MDESDLEAELQLDQLPDRLAVPEGKGPLTVFFTVLDIPNVLYATWQSERPIFFSVWFAFLKSPTYFKPSGRVSVP